MNELRLRAPRLTPAARTTAIVSLLTPRWTMEPVPIYSQNRHLQIRSPGHQRAYSLPRSFRAVGFTQIYLVVGPPICQLFNGLFASPDSCSTSISNDRRTRGCHHARTEIVHGRPKCIIGLSNPNIALQGCGAHVH